jgi:hypothetical protein
MHHGPECLCRNRGTRFLGYKPWLRLRFGYNINPLIVPGTIFALPIELYMLALSAGA